MSNFYETGEYLARAFLSRALCAPGQHTAKRRRKYTRQLRFACNFAKYSPIAIFFTLRLSNKPFLIWVSTTMLCDTL